MTDVHAHRNANLPGERDDRGRPPGQRPTRGSRFGELLFHESRSAELSDQVGNRGRSQPGATSYVRAAHRPLPAKYVQDPHQVRSTERTTLPAGVCRHQTPTLRELTSFLQASKIMAPKLGPNSPRASPLLPCWQGGYLVDEHRQLQQEEQGDAEPGVPLIRVYSPIGQKI